MSIRILERDTDVYGAPVAVVDLPTALPRDPREAATWLAAEVASARAAGVAHLTLRVPLEAGAVVAGSQRMGFYFLECLMTYAGPARSAEPPTPAVRKGTALSPFALQHLGGVFAHSRYYRDPFLSPRADEIFRRWAGDLQRDGAVFLEAVREQQVVGFAACRLSGGAELRIELIARLPTAKSEGVGDALMAAVMREASAEGRTVVMSTHADNIPAQHMLVRWGLAPVMAQATFGLRP